MNRRNAISTIIGILVSPLAFCGKTKKSVKGACKMCGFCCEHIPLKNLNPTGDKNYDAFLSYLVPSEWDASIRDSFKGYNIYKCIKLDKQTRKCSIYLERPQVCRDYPSLAVSNDEIININCGYSIEE